MSTNLDARELASLAAEAQYYGLIALQDSLQTTTKQLPSLTPKYEYRHILVTNHSWRDQEPALHKLYAVGLELMQSCITGLHNINEEDNNIDTEFMVLFLVLRRMK